MDKERRAYLAVVFQAVLISIVASQRKRDKFTHKQVRLVEGALQDVPASCRHPILKYKGIADKMAWLRPLLKVEKLTYYPTRLET